MLDVIVKPCRDNIRIACGGRTMFAEVEWDNFGRRKHVLNEPQPQQGNERDQFHGWLVDAESNTSGFPEGRVESRELR